MVGGGRGRGNGGRQRQNHSRAGSPHSHLELFRHPALNQRISWGQRPASGIAKEAPRVGSESWEPKRTKSQNTRTHSRGVNCHERPTASSFFLLPRCTTGKTASSAMRKTKSVPSTCVSSCKAVDTAKSNPKLNNPTRRSTCRKQRRQHG